MLTAFLTFMVIMVIVLYVCGMFLMRALLKVADTCDKGKLNPILFWPVYIIIQIYELIRERNFKW
ncbi:hypothetical protein FKF44_18435 [Salmonella enterica]|nr:hypothetical protein [Salmonella enterica]